MRTISIPTLILSVLVLPVWGEIPSPEDSLGFQVGADRKLADWQEIVSYFRELEQSSDRGVVQELGRTTQDNPFVLVVISHPDT